MSGYPTWRWGEAVLSPRVKYKFLLVQLESIESLLCDQLKEGFSFKDRVEFKARVALDGDITPLSGS